MGLATVERFLLDRDGPPRILLGILLTRNTESGPTLKGGSPLSMIDMDQSPTRSPVVKTLRLVAGSTGIAHSKNRHRIAKSITVITGSTQGADRLTSPRLRGEPASRPGVRHRRPGEDHSRIPMNFNSVSDTRSQMLITGEVESAGVTQQTDRPVACTLRPTARIAIGHRNLPLGPLSR